MQCPDTTEISFKMIIEDLNRTWIAPCLQAYPPEKEELLQQDIDNLFQ